MKRIYTLLLCVAALSAQTQDFIPEISSDVKQVTVFLEGAQVTRQAKATLKPGVSSIKLTGISPRIQEQSIQVEGSSSVKILSVSFRVNYLNEIQKPEKISFLENEGQRIRSLIAKEKAMQEVFKEEEVILKTNKSIGGTEKGVEIQELKIAMDYFRQRLSEIKQQLLLTDKNLEAYDEELEKIQAQLSELRGRKSQPTGEITIKVSTKNSTTADLKVKYLVQEARWFPSYDIRATNIQSPIGITYKANVSQQSGEDWDDVELTISSGNPTQVGARPLIKPWYLGFNNSVSNTISAVPQAGLYGARSANNMIHGRVVDHEGNPLPGVNVVIKGTTVGTVTDANGNYSMVATSDASALAFSFIGYQTQEVQIGNHAEVDIAMNMDVQQLSEMVVVGYGAQDSDDYSRSDYSPTYKAKKVLTATPVVRQTNIEFTLDEPFTIKSDGEVRATDMVEYELGAIFEYYCVPKLETDAFLIAKVLDWDEYNFLEGEASLFFEGKFIGRSVLDTRNTSDTLTLSLGRDGNVLVTREKVKDLSSKQFVGSNQKATFAYDIAIRNKKAQPITIVIEDQIPIPNTKEISVDKVEDSRGDYNETTGAIKWRKEIAPGKSETLKMTYTVRFPKYSSMVLE